MDVVQVVIAIIGSVVAIVAYCFMTFATKLEINEFKDASRAEFRQHKLEFRDLKSDMDKRLERIEVKLDRLIEREN